MVDLKFCLANFVHLIQEPNSGHYNYRVFNAKLNSYHVAPESNKRNSRYRTFGLPSFFRCFLILIKFAKTNNYNTKAKGAWKYITTFFRYEHTTSLKNHISLAQGESLPLWFQGNFCGGVCFDLVVERFSFVCSH